MLTLSQVTKSFGGRTLFSDVSLQVNRAERIGLVGPNGAGKSTLFSLILKESSPDDGVVAFQKGATVGYLPQESAPGGEETVLELSTAITPQIADLQQRIKDDHDHEAHALFDELGGFQLEPKAKRILSGLAFRESDFHRAARTMSGGWVMRAHLARLLVQEPDLLMLDEPTNHLDLESLVWFQSYLRGYPGAILMISHDREFLNALVDSVLDIHQGRVHRYRGNYDNFIAQTSCARRSAARGLQEPAEGDSVAAAVRRSLPGQGQQGFTGAEQAEADRADGKDRSAHKRRQEDQIPLSTAAAQRATSHHSQRHSPGIRRSCGVSRDEFLRRTRPAHGARRARTAQANPRC